MVRLSMSDKRFHVMGLNDMAQETLCLLLINMHSLFVFDQMSKLLESDSISELKHRHDLIMRHYDKISEIVFSIRNHDKDYKTMFFNEIAMDLIMKAINLFEVNDNHLTDNELAFMEPHLEGLVDLAQKSIEHLYTMEELKKAGIVE